MGTARRGLHVGMGVALVAAGVTTHLAGAQGSSGGASLTFRPPVVVIPPELQVTEPRLLVSPDGTIFLGAQYQRFDCYTGAARLAGSRACVWKSTDGGQTFSRSGGGENTAADVDFARMPSGVLLYTTLAQPEPGTFSSGVGGATILRSTDNGKTWSSSILTGLSPFVDRPFLTVVGGSTVLLTYTAWPGNLFVSRSTDDGLTWGPGIPITVVPEQAEFTRPGGPALDKKRGEVLQPYYAGSSDDPAVNQSSQSGMLDLKLARSSDGGKTWTEEMVAPRVRPVLGMHSVAADDAGHEYMVWSAQDADGRVHAYFSRNLKPGGPWSKPVTIGPADSSATLAWAVARGDGGVAIGYFGSDYPDARTVSRPWSVRVAVSQNAGNTWSIANASGEAVFTGPQSNSLSLTYDLFGFVVDNAGFLHVAFPRRVTVNGTDENEIEYTRQVSGPPLGGRTVK